MQTLSGIIFVLCLVRIHNSQHVEPTEDPNKELWVTNCTLKTGGFGVCVEFYQCEDGKTVDDGANIIDIRGHGECEYLQECCKPSNEEDGSGEPGPDPVVTPNTVVTPVSVVTPVVTPNTVVTPVSVVTPDPPTAPTGCGVRHPKGVFFDITGDTNGEAKFGEFPWMVAISKVGDSSSAFACGGSLIHWRAVLTAAHCVRGAEPASLRVRAGEWDPRTTLEVYKHQDRDVQKVVVHKHFYERALFYDVAVLILTQAVTPAQHIGLACLAEYRVPGTPGDRCFASGWGKENFDQTALRQVILKKVEVPLVSRTDCQQQLRATRLGPKFQLHTSALCAGGEAGKDACRGDGGSPLVCPTEEPDRYIQYGIVAWGIGCNQQNVPGIYVDVSVVREWIDEQILYSGLEPSLYTYKPPYAF